MKLNADEYERYYRGSARYIVAMTHQGVSIQFPASAVRKFITKEGIRGNFVITMDSNHKLVSLQKLVS